MLRIRTLIASLLGLLLVLAAVFLLGGFDWLVKIRTRQLAQQEKEWLNEWCGITIRQFPQDLMIYQRLISQLEPDVIVETGTDAGGTSLYLASILEVLKPDARVLTVDIDARKFNQTLKNLHVAGREHLLKRIQFFEGSSTDPSLFARIKSAIPEGARVMVILDSLHTRQHVYDELKLYSPLVTPDSYLIVNDTHLEGWLSSDKMSQPLSAIRDFLAEDDRFVIDESANKFVVSCAPSGFLKRVK
jgi:cephalosporin hydroxylase